MAKIVDGKALAESELTLLRSRIEATEQKPRLVVFTLDPSFETKSYLRIKTEKAKQLGVDVEINELESNTTTERVIERMNDVVEKSDGIIVQLPFPGSVDIEFVLQHLPATHDIDVIGEAATILFEEGKQTVLPPVVAAIDHVADEHNVEFSDKKVVVIGEGRLVGKPAAKWATQQGGDVTVVTEATDDIKSITEDADILILGAGEPGLIKPDMIKEGVVIFDAGTSEDGGKLTGDADPACSEKASIITPVPGGIGPVTIAMLFKNLLVLMGQKEA